MLAFVWTPPNGLSITRPVMFLLILLVFTLIFLVLSSIAQSYALFRERYRALEVVSVQRVSEPGIDWIFLIKGHLHDAIGMLIEIRRPLEDIEVPFAVVRVTGSTARGLYQAVPIWLSPGHLRDFTSQRFSASVLIASHCMYFEETRSVFDELRGMETPRELP